MKLNISPPNYICCPFCGKKLEVKIEEEKEWKYCPDCKWTYYPHVAGSACAVIVKKNKVLLVKRNREPYRGTWMFPAGFIDFGEHPDDTVRREVKEEVGLELVSLKFLEIVQVDDDPRSMGHFGFFYQVEVKDGELINNDHEENSETKWFDLDKLPEIGWHSHQIISKKYL